MRNRLILLAVAAFAGVTAAVAWAGVPHFQRFDPAQLVDGGGTAAAAKLSTASTAAAAPATDPRVFVGNIVVVGVSEGATTTLTAPFQAVYVCVNGGGNVPSAANKTTFVGTLSASATFPAAKNGKATGSLLTGPLPSSAEVAAATGFHCPSGQRLEFDRVVFSGLVLAIQGGESVPLNVTLESESVHGL